MYYVYKMCTKYKCIVYIAYVWEYVFNSRR